MIPSVDLLNSLNIERNGSEIRAIQHTRDYLDNHPDPLRAANSIIGKFKIPPLDNVKKAYVFAMTAVEQSMKHDYPTIEAIMKRANDRITHITDMIGPAAFVVEKEENLNKAPSGSRRGSKREFAKSLYLDNKDTMNDKEIIALIATEMQVSMPNAYTYLYNVKKLLSS